MAEHTDSAHDVGTEFNYFLRLPPEIRVIVYNFVLVNPSGIDIQSLPKR
jgi:hypothetical protein